MNVEPRGECEVCLGRNGGPVGIVKFAHDEGAEVTVLMCRDCMAAVFMAMVTRTSEAVKANNAEVLAVLRQLGLERAEERL